MSHTRALAVTLTLATLAPCAVAAATSATPKPAASARSAATAAQPVLPWIDDDYSKALAQARARKLPIFIESWAPW